MHQFSNVLMFSNVSMLSNLFNLRLSAIQLNSLAIRTTGADESLYKIVNDTIDINKVTQRDFLSLTFRITT